MEGQDYYGRQGVGFFRMECRKREQSACLLRQVLGGDWVLHPAATEPKKRLGTRPSTLNSTMPASSMEWT